MNFQRIKSMSFGRLKQDFITSARAGSVAVRGEGRRRGRIGTVPVSRRSRFRK